MPGSCVQYRGLQGGGALGDASIPSTPAGSMAASVRGGTYSHVAVVGGASGGKNGAASATAAAAAFTPTSGLACNRAARVFSSKNGSVRYLGLAPLRRAATTGALYNRPCAVSATQTTRVDGGPAGRPLGALNPPPPCPHALPRPLHLRKAPHPHRRRGARRRHLPRRRAPTELPSASRPRVRRGGGAPLPPHPRAHVRRLGAGGGSGCARPGAPAPSAREAAAACPSPLSCGAGGCGRCGVDDSWGDRHRPPPRVHTRSNDGAHPPAGTRTTGSEGQGR